MTRADFTWALATSSSCRTPLSAPPRMASGASLPPSRPSIVAPIDRSGSTTLPIGRLRREASPVRVEWNGREASSPAISRRQVPALPQSITTSGSRMASTPAPWTVTTPPGAVRIRTPRCSSARRVACASSPPPMCSILLLPVAMAAKRYARCEIDLSPGTLTEPRNGRAPPRTTSAGSDGIGARPVTRSPSARSGSRGQRGRPRTPAPRRRGRPRPSRHRLPRSSARSPGRRRSRRAGRRGS